MLILLLLLVTLCVQPLLALDPIVDLGYAIYRGTEDGHGNIRWAGMRYARSVSRIHGARFTAPEDPLPEAPGQIIEANAFGPICIGAHTDLKVEFGGRESEDCLFANVFAPAKATNTSALPVYVFIQGGGFSDNGNADYNGAELIDAADGQMVVVNFNYRVGPYGFLASQEIVESELSLNNGLKDQRQLLRWVQTHISKFGGDPNHVVLGGASAGAGSVILQLTAYGGRNDSLFHGIFAESSAFPPMRDVPESQFAYDALLKKTGCSDLQCLQEIDAPTFQKAARNLKMAYPNGDKPPIYFWNPTLDHDFVKDYTYNEIRAGNFLKVPSIFGDTANEGQVFIPKTVTSRQRLEQFLSDQFSNLNTEEKARMLSVWKTETATAGPNADAKWKDIASDIYGHIRYTCGTLNISSALAANASAPTWQYRWNVGTALHVSELSAIWNNGTSASAVFMQGYFASFVRSYDPNKYMTEFLLPKNVEMESPRWEEFGVPAGQSGQSGQRRMVFGNDNVVAMKQVSVEERTKCDALNAMGIQLDQETGEHGSPAGRLAPRFGKAGWLAVFLIAVLAWI